MNHDVYYARTAAIAGGYLAVSILLYRLGTTDILTFASSFIASVGVITAGWAVQKVMAFVDAPYTAYLTHSQLLAIVEFEVATYGEVCIENPTNPRTSGGNHVVGILRVPAKASRLKFVLQVEEWEGLYDQLLKWNIPWWTRRYMEHVKHRALYGPYAQLMRLTKRPQGISVWVAPRLPR